MPPDAFNKDLGFESLQRDVIRAELCAACGTCVGVCPRECISWNDTLEEPELAGECKACGLCYATCPGSKIPMPQLERMLFARERTVSEGLLGVRLAQLSGYALDSDIRERGTGGGVTTALLSYALDSGRIDGAIVADMDKDKPWSVKPRIARTTSDVLQSAKSKYCVVPCNMELKNAAKNGSRIGLVGVPCQVEAIRKIQLHEKPKKIANSVQLALGIFCGGNIPRMLTEHVILRLMGVPLEDVAAFEYRGGPRCQDVCVTTKGGEVKSVPLGQISPAIRNVFRDRCAVCLDLTAELADVSIGDIYVASSGGLRVPNVSAILVRTARGKDLIDGACNAGYLATSPMADSGFIYNVGMEMKAYFNPFRIVNRRRHLFPIPDVGRQVSYTPPQPVTERTLLAQQFQEIPELGEWIRSDRSLSQIIKNPPDVEYP